MPEPSVVFYGIKSEFFPIAYKLVEKMYALGERILFLCDNDDEVNFFNSKLWTSTKLSFIPSGNKRTISAEDSKFCYVWFSTDVTFQNEPTCLLHNGLEIPKSTDLSRFQKIIDIFNMDTIENAKSRATLYKDKGFLNQKFWIQSDGTWKQEDLV